MAEANGEPVIETNGDTNPETNGVDGNGNEEQLSPKELEELKAQEEKENERLRELEQTCNREIDNKMETLSTQMNQKFNSRMSEFSERYESHAQEAISGRQIDVLRVNKIIREVAKGLGPDSWRTVFLILMKDLKELEEAQADVDMIEKQKPFMQAYKALQVWREAMGEEFFVMNLVNALNECEQPELSTLVMDIVECGDSDALLNYGKRGSVVGGEGVKSSGLSRTPSIKREKDQDAGGSLGDRKFLRIAKQLGPAWTVLGMALGVPDDEIQEIQNNDETAPHQAAFKVLWQWRDTLKTTESEGAKTLCHALREMGKPELAEVISPPAAS